MIVSRLERDNNKEMFEVEATFGEFLFFVFLCRWRFGFCYFAVFTLSFLMERSLCKYFASDILWSIFGRHLMQNVASEI